jgi:hypothetical protein
LELFPKKFDDFIDLATESIREAAQDKGSASASWSQEEIEETVIAQVNLVTTHFALVRKNYIFRT